MVTKTFVDDLRTIMTQEEVRTGLLRVGIYTAGAVVLNAMGAPAAAGMLDMTSVASIYGANLWAVGQYPYLSPDFIATNIQNGQEIFGHQAFINGTIDGVTAEKQSPGILQQCRDTVTKVRAVTPNEAWMRLIDTAGYALDRIEAVLKPAVQIALDTKEYLAARYGATKEVALMVVSVIALGYSLRDKFREATNYGRRLFGLPEKLSADEQAMVEMSDTLMAGLAQTKDDLSHEFSAELEQRLARMERQIVDTLKEQILAVKPAPGEALSGLCVETSTSIRFDAQSLLNANISANVALAGADALRVLDLRDPEIRPIAKKASGIVWMSEHLHERMNEIGGLAAGRDLDMKTLRGPVSGSDIIREGRRKLKFSINRGLHQELLASGVSMDRLSQIVEQTAKATRDARASREVEEFISVMDQPAPEREFSCPRNVDEQSERSHMNFN